MAHPPQFKRLAAFTPTFKDASKLIKNNTSVTFEMQSNDTVGWAQNSFVWAFSLAPPVLNEHTNTTI